MHILYVVVTEHFVVDVVDDGFVAIIVVAVVVAVLASQ